MDLSSSTQNSLSQTINTYLQILFRRKWIIVFSAVPILVAGLVYCLITPLTYKASALIVVVPQKVPEAYVRSTITGRNDERIRGILQEITSRTTIEKLIKKFDLYPGMRKKYPMESVVERMQKDIAIENPREARRNAFIISYQGGDPKVVAKVTNAIANLFVEHNLKFRESQSANTAKFLSEQLSKIYVELKKREERLKQYKMAHMGELPEQRQSNLATLSALQRQLQDIQENIRRAEDRKLLLRQQLSDQMASLQLAQSQRSQASTGAGLSSGVSIAELKQRLRLLLTRYTENHPDVIALKKAIAERERELRSLKGRNSAASSNTVLTGDPALDALRLQLRATEFEIKQLKEEKRKIMRQIAVYQKRIENTPKREQELIDLTRDYENLKHTYDDLLQKKMEAEQAAALERHQQGEQFRIIDPARVPRRPIKPDLNKILPMIFVVAIGFSFGLAFLLDMLSNKYYDPEDIKNDYGFEILACIPMMLSPAEERKERMRKMAMTAAALACYVVVSGLLVLLIVKGPGSYANIV